MDIALKEADLRGITRTEALYKCSQGLDIDQDVDPIEVLEWRDRMELEYLSKSLKYSFGKWLQFIVKKRMTE